MPLRIRPGTRLYSAVCATELIAVKAPADIASRWDPVAALPGQPRGIRYARLDRLQRELFVSLLREYVDRAASAVANQAWTDITDAGLDGAEVDWLVTFTMDTSEEMEIARNLGMRELTMFTRVPYGAYHANHNGSVVTCALASPNRLPDRSLNAR